MNQEDKFISEIESSYSFSSESLILGGAMLANGIYHYLPVSVPLKTLNRHGLIAGATGTGKTKSLQLMVEGLSNAGVASIVLDIKGDISGLAASGEASSRMEERCGYLEYKPTFTAFPVEFLSVSAQKGTRIRATITEFGPAMMAKILGLNENQESVVAIIFKFCDDHKLPLLDLKDFIKVLQYISSDGKDLLKENYGNIVSTSVGTILRKSIELQQQGGDEIFGELSFDVSDLFENQEEKGKIHIFRVADILDKPKIFSSTILCLLAELYARMPEEGDLDKPKLAVFIDEAHLLFQEATPALLSQIETVVKLIRSKGVGVFFCTQNPQDIPAGVLAQLGLRIQHALRAVTAIDRKKIKEAAQNFPITEFYDVDKLITELGIGEAFVTCLDERGIPTPLVATYMRPPVSRMDILSEEEIDVIVAKSPLKLKYDEVIDRESAYEILTNKIGGLSSTVLEQPEGSKVKDILVDIWNSPITKQVKRSVGRGVADVITRTILGAIGLKKR